MAKCRFRAVIAKADVNSFVDVPAQVTRAFAAYAEQGRIRVAGTINGHPPHTTLIPTKNGAHRFYVNGGMRAATGVEVGDHVTLELRALRGAEVDLPRDLAKSLAEAGVRRRFDASSTSHRRELVRSVE